MSNYEKPIMVVDDDHMVAAMIQDTLEDAGYQVIAFTDSKKALEEIPDSGVELIISDYHMPDVSGLDLLKAVNEMQDKLGRRMSVIILSAQKDAMIALELVKHRAFAYQSKPLDIQKLLMDVSRAVTKLALP
jgi:DNA-binding NtrC family response regulator